MSTKEEEKEEKIVENEAQQQPEAEVADNEKENLTVEEELEIKLKEANDKFLRLYSDFENFRKRTQKEKLDLAEEIAERLRQEPYHRFRNDCFTKSRRFVQECKKRNCKKSEGVF